MASSKENISTFAATCNLLSQFLKENKAGLGSLAMAAGKPEPFRPPTTMSLLPGAHVSGNAEEETRNEMELFPQRAGFGPEDGAMRTHSREPEKAQMTIFYAGKVLVFDNFPAEKARDLMQLASKGSSTTNAQSNSFAPPTAATARLNVVPQMSTTTLPSTSVTLPMAVQRPPMPTQTQPTDMPIARRASLHRFLEKRKDRINARAPYQVNDSLAMVKKEETQTWLGLGPIVSNLSLSSECKR